MSREEENMRSCGSAAQGTHDILRGADLLGQLAALHGAEVQILVEQFSIQDAPHGVLKASSVTMHHPGGERGQT